VISAHGGCGIGDANAAHGTRFIGGHGLPLDGWNAGHSINTPGGFRPGAQDAPKRGALAHLVDQGNGALGIAKGNHTGFHCHGNCAACFNGVQSVGIAEIDHLADEVQVINAAVGAQRPVGFIFHTGGNRLACIIKHGVGALDDAAGAASMVVDFLAQALLVGLKNRFTGNLGSAFKASTGEVAGGETASLIQNIDEDGSTKRIQTTLGLGDGVGAQGIDHLLASLVKERLVGNFNARGSGIIQDDELDPLAAQHRTQAAASGIAVGGVILQVIEDNARVAIAIFARNTAPGNGSFLAKAFKQGRENFKQVFTGIFGGIKEFHLGEPGSSIPGDVKTPPLGFIRRLSFQNNRRQAHFARQSRPRGARIGFLDPSGERGFAAHREARRGGCCTAGDHTGGKDQLVIGSQRMAGGIYFIIDNGGCQPATGKLGIFFRQWFHCDGSIRHIDTHQKPGHIDLL